jgi:hypothetical protein
MNKGIITAACALIAPVAFAQTSTTTTEQTTASAPATTTTSESTTTYETGTVETYTPGKTIVVKREHEGPLSFALGTTARIVNGAGKIVTAPLRPGERVKVYYKGSGDNRVVEHVQVED